MFYSDIFWIRSEIYLFCSILKIWDVSLLQGWVTKLPNVQYVKLTNIPISRFIIFVPFWRSEIYQFCSILKIWDLSVLFHSEDLRFISFVPFWRSEIYQFCSILRIWDVSLFQGWFTKLSNVLYVKFTTIPICIYMIYIKCMLKINTLINNVSRQILFKSQSIMKNRINGSRSSLA